MKSNRAVLKEMKREAKETLEHAIMVTLKAMRELYPNPPEYIVDGHVEWLKRIYFSKSGHTVHRNRYAMAVYKMAFEMAKGKPYEVVYNLLWIMEDIKFELEYHSGGEVVGMPFERKLWFGQEE